MQLVGCAEHASLSDSGPLESRPGWSSTVKEPAYAALKWKEMDVVIVHFIIHKERQV